MALAYWIDEKQNAEHFNATICNIMIVTGDAQRNNLTLDGSLLFFLLS